MRWGPCSPASRSPAFRPYGGTFLIFSDYMRPAIRLAALMGLPVVYVFTHDSIFLGEDGPTHQPIDQLASLRAIPGLVTLRPAEAWETAQAWRVAIERTAGPTALALTRQTVPTLEETNTGMVEKGAYVLRDFGEPGVILMAVTATEAVDRLHTWASGRCLNADRPGIYTREGTQPSSRRKVARSPLSN